MRPRVLLIDNYDSFTYNLAQALWALGAEVLVHRNDAIDVARARALAPTHLVISPGPGRPEAAGVSPALLAELGPEVPTLGVCLGHQALGAVCGAVVGYAPRLMHGKSSWVHHDGSGLFAGIGNPFQAARYHSLVVEEAGLPDALEVTCRTEEGEVMGLRHRSWPAFGVQFHPESVLTPEGPRMLATYLAFSR